MLRGGTQDLKTSGRGWQYHLFLIFLIGFILELVNSLYLFFFPSPRLFYMAMVLSHIFLGFFLTALLVAYGISHFLTLQNKQLRLGIWTGVVTFTALLLCFGFGINLTFEGVPRHNIWKLYLHIGLGIVSILSLVFHLLNTDLFKNFRLIYGTLLSQGKLMFVISALGFGIVILSTGSLFSNPYELISISTENVSHPFDEQRPKLSYDEHSNPFFPSLATTLTGDLIPSENLGDSISCGFSGCHEDLFQQWQSSAHRHSSFNNPFYRRATEYMGERVGYPSTKFCGGCHDPLLIFSGKMNDPIDTTKWESNAGITCLSCHSIVKIRDVRGNGSYVIEDPPRYPFASSQNPMFQSLNRLLIRVKPESHRKAFLKSLHQTPEFCSVCHKVHIPEQVNGYRWLRGQDEYDSWQDSGVSGFSVRSWYPTDQPKQCSDCHMPKVLSMDMGQKKGLISSHRFLGPNSALPFLHQDEDQLQAVKDFLTDRRVTLDIIAIKRWTDAGYDPCYIPINTCEVKPAETIIIEVVVRNQGVGHSFPGGTIDSNEVWVDFRVKDNREQQILISGNLNQQHYVDPAAHFFKALLLDRSAQPINKRNIHDWVSTVYAQTIPPGASDVIHFKVRIPETAQFPLIVEAKLNYRKFNRWFTNWTFSGQRASNQNSIRIDRYVDESKWVFDEKQVPVLPIIRMSSAQTKLFQKEGLGPDENIESEKSNTLPINERLNDYGTALLLQDNYREAIMVFKAGLRRYPHDLAIRLNLSRALIGEGNLAAAEKHLRVLLDGPSETERPLYFLAEILTKRGRYDEAIAALRVVVEAYPKDRMVHNNLAHLYYLVGDVQRASDEVSVVLRIDPENLAAYYIGLLLAFQADNANKAKELEQHYLRFKPDEEGTVLSGLYQLIDPFGKREAQLNHFH